MKILSKLRNNRVGYCLGRWFLSRRFVNNSRIYQRIYSEKIAEKMRRFEQNPPSIDIGTTNFCNAECIMCPHSKLKKLGTMNFELYKKIIDEANELGVNSICLTFFGEPLIDKGIYEKIKYTKSKGMYISFFSNGSIMDLKASKKLIESGLDSIRISFDGYTKETYEKIRKNLNFDVVRKNILGLINLKKSLGVSHPKVALTMVEQEENAKEIKKF